MFSKSISRRRILHSGIEIGCALAAPGVLSAGITFDPAQEKEKKSAAKFVMTFGSPYASENRNFSPHMHQEFKNNIQTLSGGKIYVDIFDKGKFGIGPKLMSRLARNHVNAGLVSVANLVPIAPELDVLNIPFWSANNQDYVNLVTSPIWDSLILAKIRENSSIDVLFHYVVGPRTITTTKSYRKLIKTPDDAKGLRFRVPSSKTLATFYRLVGAKSKSIAWGKTAEAARNDLFDALDPAIIGLYNGPDNLKNELSAISRIESVQDGWMAVVNVEWLKALPNDLREVVFQASEKTFKEQLKKVKKVTDICMSKFAALGTTMYEPSASEIQQWIDCCGHSRPEWAPIKKSILGNASTFDKLLTATKSNNGYTIS